MQKVWKDYGAITLGTILIGLATKNIFDPASMVDVYKRQPVWDVSFT